MNKPEYILRANETETVGEVTLQQGNTYLLNRQNAAELLAATDHADVQPTDNFWLAKSHKIDESTWNGRSLLFCRSGGIGDILAITPTLHEIKTRWPQCSISFATHARHAGILENNPDVDLILPWPLRMDQWTRAGNPLWLDCLMEDDQDTKETHFVDLVAKSVGIAYIKDKRMRYTVTPAERDDAARTFPKEKKRIGIQVHSNALNRTYPWEKMREVVIHFMRTGWEIALFGNESILKNTGEHGVIFANNLPLRQACALVETCDAFVAPDSAFCHIAGAMDIPTVALYGPFHWRTRTKYAPSIDPIQGNSPCSPCYHHVRRGEQFCDGCPTAAKGFCDAMADISPKRIIRNIERMAAK